MFLVPLATAQTPPNNTIPGENLTSQASNRHPEPLATLELKHPPARKAGTKVMLGTEVKVAAKPAPKVVRELRSMRAVSPAPAASTRIVFHLLPLPSAPLRLRRFRP